MYVFKYSVTKHEFVSLLFSLCRLFLLVWKNAMIISEYMMSFSTPYWEKYGSTRTNSSAPAAMIWLCFSTAMAVHQEEDFMQTGS